MAYSTDIVRDWTTAMKAGDSKRSLALANMKSALLNRAIELGARKTGLTDEQALDVLRKMAKQSRDTIESLPADSALREKEEFELSIISSYLPKALTEDEVRERVYSILKDSGVSDLGAGMKLCLPELKSRADGRQVQLFVKQFIEENKND